MYVLQSEKTTRILIELKLNRNFVILFSFHRYMKFNNKFGNEAISDTIFITKIRMPVKSVRIDWILGEFKI